MLSSYAKRSTTPSNVPTPSHWPRQNERFFDLERAYRSRRLVLVGVAGEALRALRIPPVPPTASPEGWLLGTANISVVRVGGLGPLEDRIDTDRVETESLADRTIGQ